ncbi:MAG: hypothetical protein AB9891_09720 [Anaerolineaceae bacterium]
MRILKKITFKPSTVPAALLVLCLAAFGLLVPTLGFYWDDWAKILVDRLFGPAGYWQYYAGDRPLSAWTHVLLTPLLGHNPLGWQIFTPLMRWLSAVGVWWSLSNLWPQARRTAAAAALVFAVYPLFAQQPIALTFHQQWMQFALYLFSLGAMTMAWRKPRQAILWTILSLAAIALELSITEYFAPLELLRPLVLWFLVSEKNLDRAKKWKTFFIQWLPFLLLAGFYVVWRLFLMKLPGEDPYRAETLYSFLASPLATLVSLLKTMLVDLIQMLFSSWRDVFDLNLGASLPPFTMAALVVAVLTSILSAFYLSRLETDPASETRSAKPWLGQALLLACTAILLGPVPAWITGRQVVFDFHSDRYALPALFGLSLLLAASIEWLSRGRRQQAVLAAVLIGISVLFHLRNANEYRWVWNSQMDLAWQLAWRSPQIEAPTAILSENELIPNQGLFSTSASLNLLYPQPEGAEKLAYWAYTLRPRYAAGAPQPLSLSYSTTFRTLTFSASSPNTLLIHNDPSRGNCLWVLSEEDAGNPYLPALVKEFLPASNLERIISRRNAPGYPPEEFFGAEPAHDWCYYYQKVSLAGQFADWAEAASLADQAMSLGYTPLASGSNSPQEWLPFITAYARSGRLDEALNLTRQSYEQDPKYSQRLCRLWADLEKTSPEMEGFGESRNEVNGRLNCAAE